MKKVFAAVSAFVVSSTLAQAADMPMGYPPPVLWSWTGLYLGGHLGGAAGTAQFSDPAGAGIYGGNVLSQAMIGGGQIGYNWQVPNANWVLGVEAEASALRADGTATCLASSGYFISANCRVRPEATGSLTARAGFAIGPHGRTLVYARVGVAWLEDRMDITTNGLYPPPMTSVEGARFGWTVGGGVERALTPAWSLRLAYDYAKFGDVGMDTPASFQQVIPGSPFGYLPTLSGTTSVSQDLHTVKLGLNYRIGRDINARWEPEASDYHLRGSTDGAYVQEAEIEIGGRVWYSSGRFQKDLGGTADASLSNLLVSRLTYDSTAATGEVFGRLDTTSHIFLKGFIGGGKLVSGNMHDEDWVIFDAAVPYSNTLSSVKGDLAYATADVGYSLFRGPSANVGGFVGFNYYQENKLAYGCSQIANAFSDCVPALPGSVLGISEKDQWYSFRVGINGVVTLADRLKLTADAAYLPWVGFRGTDNHMLRTDVTNTISPETGGGQGFQLEAILSYMVAQNFSVGAGARYWAMWAAATSDTFGLGCPCQTLPVHTDRYGAFLQAAYKFDGPK
jgi:opacity protein-like surface antigen